MNGSPFEQTWIPYNKECLVPNLVETGPVVLEEISSSPELNAQGGFSDCLSSFCLSVNFSQIFFSTPESLGQS